MFTGTGRKKDIVWNYFSEVKTNSKSNRAKCNNCDTEMSALVSRMKTHIYERCSGAGSSNNIDNPSSSSNYIIN